MDYASYFASPQGVGIDLLYHTAAGGHADGDTLVSIENLVGSPYDDVLLGDRQGNLLEGRAGTDTLDGREGEDMLIGGSGSDKLIGGADKDVFQFDFRRPGEFDSPPDIGDDVIMDWESGRDSLLITNRAPEMAMEAVQAGADVVLRFKEVYGTITILNAQVSEFEFLII